MITYPVRFARSMPAILPAYFGQRIKQVKPEHQPPIVAVPQKLNKQEARGSAGPLAPKIVRNREFEPHTRLGPLGNVNCGYDVWAIIALRAMVWDRNTDVFRLDDRSLCIACCASPFAVPVYNVKPDDSPTWFQGTAMMLARWVEVADRYASWIARLPHSERGYRCGELKLLRPYVMKFLQDRYLSCLPESLHDDPITMTLLDRIVRGLGVKASALTLNGVPLDQHGPFVEAQTRALQTPESRTLPRSLWSRLRTALTESLSDNFMSDTA